MSEAIHNILYFTITFWINFYPRQNIEIPTVGPSHLITYPSGLLCKWARNPKLATAEISIFWYRQKLIQNVIVKYNILQIASDTPQNKISCKTDNVLSEYNILQLSSELTSTSVKILKFPMCEEQGFWEKLNLWESVWEPPGTESVPFSGRACEINIWGGLVTGEFGSVLQFVKSSENYARLCSRLMRFATAIELQVWAT